MTDAGPAFYQQSQQCSGRAGFDDGGTDTKMEVDRFLREPEKHITELNDIAFCQLVGADFPVIDEDTIG